MSITLLLDKYDISSEEGLQRALNEIEKEETEVNEALANALSRACTLEGRLRAASQGYSKLGAIKSDAEVAAQMVEKTASLARDVSAKVRQLDLARSRVAECQRRVHDLIDLRVCSAGVEQAIKSHDYETAAGHVARFLSMEPGSVAAASARGDDPRADMTRAAHTLREHLGRKFEEAAKKEDEQAIERLFKLFPQIGCMDEGIDLLAKYLAEQLELKIRRASTLGAREGGAVYADWVTRVLEAAAATVERCRRLLPAPPPPSALPRALLLVQPTVCAGVRRACGELVRARRLPDGGEPLAAEPALAELALTLSRIQLYFTFLRRRSEHISGLDEGGKAVCSDAVEKIILECDLTRTAQDVLNHYLTLERYFLEESVNKAIKMSSSQPGATSSSLVDDVFYIARKVIRRSISTGSLEGACVALNEASAQLERCAATLRRRLAAPPPTPLPLPAPGAAPSSPDPLYLAYMNEAEAGAGWAERVAAEAVQEAGGLCRGDAERAKLVSCAGTLSAAAAAFRAAHDLALGAVRAALQPALALWADALAAPHHDAEEMEEDADALPAALDALADAARQQLAHAADALLVGVVTDLVTRAEKAILRNHYERNGALYVERRCRRLAAWAGGEAGGARERCAALCAVGALLALERPAHAADAGGHTARLPPHVVRDVLARRTDFKLEEIKRLKL